jgi:hypothetical protein
VEAEVISALHEREAFSFTDAVTDADRMHLGLQSLQLTERIHQDFLETSGVERPQFRCAPAADGGADRVTLHVFANLVIKPSRASPTRLEALETPAFWAREPGPRPLLLALSG